MILGMCHRLLLFVFVWILSGCQSDACVRLCTRVTLEVDSCLDEWNVDWAYLDANSASAFEESCQTLWTEQSREFEWRQREEVADQCSTTIDSFNRGEMDCDVLRRLYFY